jgi:peptide/nickel transport system permease protein
VLVKAVLALLLTVFVTAILVRLAPGWDIDETAMDARASGETVYRRNLARGAGSDFLHFYLQRVFGLLHGDLGTSVIFERPCSELLYERLPATLRLTAVGLAVGWVAAMSLATAQAVMGNRASGMLSNTLIAVLLSIPAPILGLACAAMRGPAELAMIAFTLPRALRYSGHLLAAVEQAPFVMTAHGLGIGKLRIVLKHILPVCLPQLLALCGALVPIALGATVPIEVVADVPGLGQLAWKATLGRDVPLLIAVTMVMAGVSLVANGLSAIPVKAEQ